MYLKFINFTYSKNILIDGVAITVGIITFKTFQRIKMKSIDIGIFSLIYVNETLWRLDHSIKDWNGYLLNCMHKQQDFFGCLAKILGCLGLREAANLEIWPLRPRRGKKGQSSKVGSLKKARTTQNWGQTSKKVALFGLIM